MKTEPNPPPPPPSVRPQPPTPPTVSNVTLAFLFVPVLLISGFNVSCAAKDSCRNYASDTGVVPGPGWISFLTFPYLVIIAGLAMWMSSRKKTEFAELLFVVCGIGLAAAWIVL